MKASYRSSLDYGIRSWILSCLVGAVIAICIPHVSRAQTAILQNLSGTVSSFSTGYTYGLGFTVGSQPISITALGMWDESDNGVGGSNQVGLWTAAGSPLTSITISSGTGSAQFINHFRYENITPVTLNANTTYILGFYNASNDFMYAGSSSTFTLSSEVTFVGTGAAFGFAAPSDISNNYLGTGANALYSAIPEPSTYAAFFGLAALGFAAYRRRQKQSA
jgi:hypothetical protein